MGFWSTLYDYTLKPAYDYVLEPGSRKILSGGGYVASWVGAEDTAEFLWSAGNSSYVAKAFRPALTEEERKTRNDLITKSEKQTLNKEEQDVLKRFNDLIDKNSKESKRYADNVTNNIAPNIETIGVEIMNAPVTLLSGGVTQFTGSPVTAIGDIILKVNDPAAAPLRSLHSLAMPSEIPLIGGDKHYQNGGRLDNHPESIEFKEMIKKVKAESYAKYGLGPNGKPLAENRPQKPATEPASGQTQSTLGKPALEFGAGSIIGAIVLGVVGFLSGGFIGAGVAALAGGLLGQPATDTLSRYFEKSAVPSPQPSTTGNPDTLAPSSDRLGDALILPSPTPKGNVTALNNMTAAKGK